MREKLLSGDLWAARIDKLWKEVDDGVYWIRACWYMIPEETVSGRQPHNLKRELYLTNDFADIEMECILRHCSVKCPKEFSKASNDGDDVFLCEYEYDVHWRSFKRLAELVDGDSDSDQEWNGRKEEKVDDSDEEMELDDGVLKSKRGGLTSASGGANSCKGRVFGIEKNLKAEVEEGSVEINGLKLASPENIYNVIYEALSGHRVGYEERIETEIILCEPGEKHRFQKLQLNFPSDDVAFALKDNKDLPWLANYLYLSAAACIVLNTVDSVQPSPISPETVDSLLPSGDLESRLKKSRKSSG
ncbi:hypothetical protein AXX17_ATUG04640 [Arabidopsis thaliana]|uniref:Origin recognition complex subunit 1 n=1 Tax=Arabidopsis thaliana TaxID=3702 RepID=A0A178U571_ARATH|nr:hypothetical protein AXX17_ATUG04640 [Arabidopsis thaliana]